MKILINILTIYFLALFVVPCSDMDGHSASSSFVNTHQDQHTQDQHTQDQHEQDQHEHRNDGCSPFCSCTCCSISMVSINLFDNHVESPLAINLAAPFVVETTAAIGNHPSSIWQPPKHNV